MFHMTFNNHCICTHYMYVSICFEFDKVVFFSLTSFAYVKKKKGRKKKEKRKVMSSTSNVYMN